MNHLVIMAGGTGSRFWPLSTVERPKQFIDVLGVGKTLIQLTADRFRTICAPAQMWVVTSEKYIDLVREQLPEIPMENILQEPCARNTAPCIAYAAWKIRERDLEANLIISPSDHLVTEPETFRSIIRKGLSFGGCRKAIVTVGILPTRVETGYGYIKVGNDYPQDVFYVAESFEEKPDRETAGRYVREKNYYWNSGIFICNVNTMVEALRKFQPAMACIFDRISEGFNSSEEGRLVAEYFPQTEKISIDYAVMERADNIYVIPASFGWSDLGSWGSIYDLSNKDEKMNAVTAESIKLIDSTNNIVVSTQRKRCIVEGLAGYVVVDTDDSLLICKRASEQLIKEWIE